MESVFEQMSSAELASKIAEYEAEVERLRSLGLSLDMTRGKPSPEQVELSKPMLDTLNSTSDLTDHGVDAGNYGGPFGLQSARDLFAEILGADVENVFVGGSSSLNIMFDIITHCYIKGLRGCEPWSKQEKVRFLCPSPGYDRHFGVTAYFGIENVPVAMGPDGPDMDEVVRLVESDPTIKGIWCVPKYQNPTGYTFSDECVRRFAALKPAASDFRIFWDNAYAVHDFTATPDELLSIHKAMSEAGTSDLVFEFASTSKITFPGSGAACMVASSEDMADVRKTFTTERVCSNKMTQLEHARWMPDLAHVKEQMAKQAEVLRPRFELVQTKLTEGLGELGCATWTNPAGGYFVSFDGPQGSARSIVSLADELGVKMTAAGATWPYGSDPGDTNIRIAPSFPSLQDLGQALDVFVACVKLVSARLAQQRSDA